MIPQVCSADWLKSNGLSLGLSAVGIAPAVPLPGFPRFQDWLSKGHAAGMDYLHRQADARAHPDSILDGVRSIVVCLASYNHPTPADATPNLGRVARYAWGQDYHRVLWDKLNLLLDRVREQVPQVRGRAVVDTAPLLERDIARLAGLGWIGKNTMLIHKRLGSFTFLGALLLDIELDYDHPFAANHCGSCTRCLDACPTDAFVGPYQLDARRCISYLTIEHRGPIPEALAGQLDGWVFGCDICQDVCPWNRKAVPATAPEFAPRPEWTRPDLLAWLEADPDAFRAVVRASPLARAKRAGLVRNAALVLGAKRVAAARPALERLLDDPDPGVRAAAEWALRGLTDRPKVMPDDGAETQQA
jgi:epoxyqueuosine reductase